MRRGVAWLALGAYCAFLASGPLHAVLHRPPPVPSGAESPTIATHRGCSCCAPVRFLPALLLDDPVESHGEDRPRTPTPDTPPPGNDPPCPICQAVLHGFVETVAPPPPPSVPQGAESVGQRYAGFLPSPMREDHRARAPPAC